MEEEKKTNVWNFASRHPFIFWFIMGDLCMVIKWLVKAIAHVIRPGCMDTTIRISPTEDTNSSEDNTNEEVAATE